MKCTKNPGNQALSFRSGGLDAVSLATWFEKNKSFSRQCGEAQASILGQDAGPQLGLPLPHSHTPTLPQDQPCAWLWICGWKGGQQTARFEKHFGHRVKNADLRVTLISFPQLLQTNSHSPISLIFLINGFYNYISFRDVQQQKL